MFIVEWLVLVCLFSKQFDVET